MNPLSIRSYNKETDEAKLLQCITELQDFERNIEISKLTGSEIAEKYLKHILKETEENLGRIFVAETKEKIVGFISAWIDEEEDITIHKEPTFYISDIYVKPEFRKQRIATKLIGVVKEYALNQNVRRMTVSTLANNSNIQELLKSQGFIAQEITWQLK